MNYATSTQRKFHNHQNYIFAGNGTHANTKSGQLQPCVWGYMPLSSLEEKLSSVHLQIRKPDSFWTSSKKLWSADQGRWFSSSPLPPWDVIWSTTSTSNIRRTWTYQGKSRGGHGRSTSPVKTIHFAEQHRGQRVHMLLPIPCPCC